MESGLATSVRKDNLAIPFLLAGTKEHMRSRTASRSDFRKFVAVLDL